MRTTGWGGQRTCKYCCIEGPPFKGCPLKDQSSWASKQGKIPGFATTGYRSNVIYHWNLPESFSQVCPQWSIVENLCNMCVSAQIYGCSQSVRKYHMKIDKIDVICTQKDGKNLGKNDVFIKYNFSCFSDWTILAGVGGGEGHWPLVPSTSGGRPAGLSLGSRLDLCRVDSTCCSLCSASDSK